MFIGNLHDIYWAFDTRSIYKAIQCLLQDLQIPGFAKRDSFTIHPSKLLI